MSHRPINEKRSRRVRRAIERKSLPAFVRPERWLRTHGYAQTAGEARKLILDGRLKINANKVGFAEVKVEDADGNRSTQKVVVDIPAEQFDPRAVTVVPA